MEKTVQLKVRPAKEVADYIKFDDPFDLVISFGHELPEDAVTLVRAVPAEGQLGPGDKPYHLSLDASHWPSYRDGSHIAFRAVELDEWLEHDLGRLPRILVHCEYGLKRSPMLGLFLHATRLLRQDPIPEVGAVVEQVMLDTLTGPDRDWQIFDMPQRD